MINSSRSFNVHRVQHNIAALYELHAKHPNPHILKKYSGWGGLRNAIYTPHVYLKLKKIASPEAILSLKHTLSNAYFTPVVLVRFLFALLLKLNRPFRTILEPSAGHGIFFEHMPLVWRKNAAITAVEMDDLSVQFIQGLYPNIKLHHQTFEQFHPQQRYDLIIGNPPYGKQLVDDQQHPDLAQFPIHHYFVAKSMRLLNDGGILAMVLPRYFLDNCKDHVRGIIARDGGSLLAAYRFPDNLFDDATVTVDVIILQKGGSTHHPWINARRITIENTSTHLNQYFHHYPQHVLGKLEMVPAWDRLTLTCRVDNTLDYKAAIKQCLIHFNQG